MSSRRRLGKIVPIRPGGEPGDGSFLDKRTVCPCPAITTADADPFLLIREQGPGVLSPKDAEGEAWHPHRGIDIITYVKEGSFMFQDTFGGVGEVKDGDAQLLRTGAGVIHDEGRGRRAAQRNCFTVWVNLPAAEKSVAPAMYCMRATKNQWVQYQSEDNSLVTVKILAGAFADFALTLPTLPTASPVLIADVRVGAGGRTTLMVPKSMETALLFVYEGEGRVFDGAVDPLGHALLQHECATFLEPLQEEGEEMSLNGSGGIRFEAADTADVCALLLCGRKLREPVAQYGGIVVNSDGEIKKAMDEYAAGTFATTKPFSSLV